MSSSIIFFDLLSSDNRGCFALNPWKVCARQRTSMILLPWLTWHPTRKAGAALNYKGLSYETVWSEYVELAETLRAHDIPAHSNPGTWEPEYGSPAIQLPDGRCVMGSIECAKALEDLQPEHSLRLDNGYIDRGIQVTMMMMMMGNMGELFPAYTANCSTPRDREYFERTRSEWFGVGSFAELASDPTKTGEAGWKASQPGFRACRELPAEHVEGPFVEGR